MQERKDTKSGFTLIETVISVLVVTLGMAGAMGLAGWMMRANQWSDQMIDAAFQAQDVQESVRGLPYASLVDQTNQIGNYDLQMTVTAASSHKIVNTSVSWTDLDGRTRNYNLQTVHSAPASPGFYVAGGTGF